MQKVSDLLSFLVVCQVRRTKTWNNFGKFYKKTKMAAVFKRLIKKITSNERKIGFLFYSPDRINSSLIIISLFLKQYSEKTMIILFLDGMLYYLSGLYCLYITGAYLVTKKNESNFICLKKKKKKMKWLSIYFKVHFFRKNNSYAPFLRKKLLSFLYL